MTLDAHALSSRWKRAWPGVRPIGHELRYDRERWVRFHSLPESKRYPENESEYAEVLRRHNTVLDELVSGSSASLLVMTVSWSASALPPPRDADLVQVMPDAHHWTSVLREKDEDGDEYWTHVYVTECVWQPGALDPLLRLVADDGTADVIVADAELRWLVHPYDGGMDVVTETRAQRNELRLRHATWLSAYPGGL